MDVISRYAIESTVWWEHGEGEKLDDDGNPAPGSKKVDKDKPGKKPAPVAPRGSVATVSAPAERPGGLASTSFVRTLLAEPTHLSERPAEPAGGR